MARVITGIVRTRSSAMLLAEDFIRHGFSQDDISLLMSETTRGPEFVVAEHTKAPEATVVGATIGGVLGAIALGLTSAGLVSAPGLGVFVVGQWLSMLAGFGAGGLAGGLIGGLIGLGVPEHEAELYHGEVEKGGILFGLYVNNERAKEAHQLMETNGAEHVRVGNAKEDTVQTVSVTGNFDSVPNATDDPPVQDTQIKRAYSESVLTDLRLRRESSPALWLKELAEESIIDNPEVVNMYRSSALGLQEQMFTWVDGMFDEFENYSREFNTRAAGTDLIVSCTRPKWSTCVDPNDESVPVSSGGYLATRFWFMYFNVRNDLLEIYLLPSNVLLTFSTGNGDHFGYEAFLVIEGKVEDGQFLWDLGEVKIKENRLASLARELFSDFIRVASGIAADEQQETEQSQMVVASTESKESHLQVCQTNEPAHDASLEMT